MNGRAGSPPLLSLSLHPHSPSHLFATHSNSIPLTLPLILILILLIIVIVIIVISCKDIFENEIKAPRISTTSIQKVFPLNSLSNSLAFLYLTSTFSIISDVFQGELLGHVKCLECKRTSSKFERFYDLSVGIPEKRLKIPGRTDADGKEEKSGFFATLGSLFSSNKGKITIDDCIYNFCQPEVLTGSERYKCEHCDKFTDSEKSYEVWKLPEVLCIHLKRFRYDYFGSKVSTEVHFPLTNLDMDMHLAAEADQQESIYNLVGLVNHSGGLSGGHYIAYARNYKTESWYEFDDSYVTKMDDEKSVQDVEAYVLFFERRREGQDSERSQVRSMIHEARGKSKSSQYMLSKRWYHRFKTMADPGPIDNHDFLCPHGDVNPKDADRVDDLIKVIPKDCWDYLHDRYGGGPMRRNDNRTVCEDCSATLEVHRERCNEEKDTINELDALPREPGDYWYIIENSWLSKWHTFTSNPNDPEIESPGEITNRFLVQQDGVTPRRGLKKAHDYRGVNKHVWNFFIEKYGGGPTIRRKKLDIYYLN
eukprot:TRINITY_DN221_c0_g1_i8.p1 TRINITY_DN221_c0_g1~~TRINITY_DN221_c0_g1_i8.p1  ORF type:complete len:536 (+),score=119.67 TRINITY_DN221_c0_g1_i8:1268-2875(+)